MLGPGRRTKHVVCDDSRGAGKRSELIHRLTPGDELVITENDQPVARLVETKEEPKRKPRQPGTLRGTVLYMAPDFDAPLEDFKEYME